MNNSIFDYWHYSITSDPATLSVSFCDKNQIETVIFKDWPLIKNPTEDEIKQFLNEVVELTPRGGQLLAAITESNQYCTLNDITSIFYEELDLYEIYPNVDNLERLGTYALVHDLIEIDGEALTYTEANNPAELKMLGTLVAKHTAGCFVSQGFLRYLC